MTDVSHTQHFIFFKLLFYMTLLCCVLSIVKTCWCVCLKKEITFLKSKKKGNAASISKNNWKYARIKWEFWQVHLAIMYLYFGICFLYFVVIHILTDMVNTQWSINAEIKSKKRIKTNNIYISMINLLNYWCSL